MDKCRGSSSWAPLSAFTMKACQGHLLVMVILPIPCFWLLGSIKQDLFSLLLKVYRKQNSSLMLEMSP